MMDNMLQQKKPVKNTKKKPTKKVTAILEPHPNYGSCCSKIQEEIVEPESKPNHDRWWNFFGLCFT